ncbi:hypothetical protein EJ05DRAFT_501484 [Pseudovirgaria hyperparasitica]|uniref:Major facilitator superfamily (MFS) profile domain-containing protein n=1 Tax=Pseudovirgaria hyperparasitica TaxID=470096 RepID=A0A6A6W445_9PEZI|nr:uncharacterized protein EJ05DRAFT_501484 [Pseudovirgaria hyperparasitica]KAF2756939.1 hypothetical protein EJ05DRAFT_501484 [Pseudovirgaria hyperparasitica]
MLLVPRVPGFAVASTFISLGGILNGYLSSGQRLNLFSNFLVAVATPAFLARSAYGAYFLFGCLILSTVVVLAAYMPATKGRSLEGMHEAFKQPPWRSWASFLRGLASASSVSVSEAMGAGENNQSVQLDELSRDSGEAMAFGALGEVEGPVRILTTV